jgi:mono/diheme cytochrome c family protein
MNTTEFHHDRLDPTGRITGVVARFESAETLVEAARAVREAGFRRWDAHSPMPVHGLERAMGIRLTILPWIVLGAGITGGALGLLLQWFANSVDYPLIISGKPLFSLPANIPVVFELIVLFSALTAFAGALALSGLPQFWHDLFGNRAFHRVTSDAYFISIDARDYKFDETEVPRFLQSLGASAVDLHHEPAAGRAIPRQVFWALAAVIVVAPIPFLVVTWYRAIPKSQPRIQFLHDMDAQPKYQAQAASPVFEDRRASRPQVPGAVARGRPPTDVHFHQGKDGQQWAKTYPASVRLGLTTMQRGRERFNVYCTPCHGFAGDGDGLTSARALQRGEGQWVPPLQLYASSVRFQPVGQLFNTITNGVRKMPAYGAQIPVADRWAIVLYLQALQRSQSAKAEDLPDEVREKLVR